MSIDKIRSQHRWLVSIWYICLVCFIGVSIFLLFTNGMLAFITSMITLYILVHRYIFGRLDDMRDSYLPYVLKGFFTSKKVQILVSYKQHIPRSIIAISSLFDLSSCDTISYYKVHIKEWNNLIISQLFLTQKSLMGSNIIKYRGYFAVCDLPDAPKHHPALHITQKSKKRLLHRNSSKVLDMLQDDESIGFGKEYNVGLLQNTSKSSIDFVLSKEFTRLACQIKKQSYRLSLSIINNKVYMYIEDSKKTGIFERDLMRPLKKQTWNKRQCDALRFLTQLQDRVQLVRFKD